jgi:mediator of RNA polymerase II transcription subunit 5
MDPLIKEWTLFLDRCLEFRIRPELFEATAAQLYGKSPLPGRKLANLLLRPRTAAASSIDPLIIIYAEHLLAANRIDASDVLVSAFQFSRDRPPRAGEDQNPVKDNPSRWYNPPELEEILFQRLQKAFSTGKRPATNEEAVHTVAMVSRWMSAMVTSHTNDSMIQAMAGIQQHPHQQSINLREGLGMLVVGLIENGRILQLLSKQQVRGMYFAIIASRYRFHRSSPFVTLFTSTHRFQKFKRLSPCRLHVLYLFCLRPRLR